MAPVRRRERWSPTAAAARPPRVVILWRLLRGSLRVARIRCCSLRWCGVFGCSGIATKDPAWRRPSWCGVVRLFVSFSTLGPTEVFSTIIRVWSADGCCGLFRLCCRFVWGGYLWASRGSLSSPRVDDPIQPSELSCCVPRVDVPI